jgi:hypothetical protein
VCVITSKSRDLCLWEYHKNIDNYRKYNADWSLILCLITYIYIPWIHINCYATFMQYPIKYGDVDWLIYRSNIESTNDIKNNKNEI